MKRKGWRPRHTHEGAQSCSKKKDLRGYMEGGRSQKAEQLYVGFTCRNFGPCGAQEEEVLDGIKNGGRQKQKCNLGTSALFTRVNK